MELGIRDFEYRHIDWNLTKWVVWGQLFSPKEDWDMWRSARRLRKYLAFRVEVE